jgi:hypothetical protein
MPECSICSHPDRSAIDEALISGASVREVESQWGVSRSATSRHRTGHLPAPGDVPAQPPSSDLAAAYRDLAASARRAFEAAMKAGRTQDASNSLRAWETALAKLTDLEAPTAPAAESRPQRGLSPEMARSIMTQTLGLSDEQADRMLDPASAPPPPPYRPETPTKRADDAVARFNARTAPPKSEPATAPKPTPPKPRPRPTGPVRFGGDHTVCHCDEADVDADCPAHGGSPVGDRGGFGALF